MTISSIQSRIQRIEKDMFDLNRKISELDKKILECNKEISRAEKSLAGTKSLSSANSYRSKLQREREKILDHQQGKDRLARELIKKQENLAKEKKDLQSEEQKLAKKSTEETKKKDETIKKLQNKINALAIQNSQQVEQKYSSSSGSNHKEYDVFVSHAYEDKDSFVRGLVNELIALNLTVWYDELTLKMGSKLRQSIDKGLVSSRFGVVVLSHAFFAKNWTNYELDGLFAKENRPKSKGGSNDVILPIWHNISKDEVTAYSPSLANTVALSTAVYTVKDIAQEIYNIVKSEDL